MRLKSYCKKTLVMFFILMMCTNTVWADTADMPDNSSDSSIGVEDQVRETENSSSDESENDADQPLAGTDQTVENEEKDETTDPVKEDDSDEPTVTATRQNETEADKNEKSDTAESYSSDESEEAEESDESEETDNNGADESDNDESETELNSVEKDIPGEESENEAEIEKTDETEGTEEDEITDDEDISVDLTPQDDDTVYEAIIDYRWDQDIIERMSYNEDEDYIEWDSALGPYYKLRLSTGELLDCWSQNAKVLSYSKKGNIVKVKVISDEKPTETEYVLDLSRDYSVFTDYVDSFDVSSVNTVSFDSLYGPRYEIDYKNKKVLDCSSTNPQIIKCELKGEILTLVVKSDELPKKVKYVFDLLPHYDDDENIYDAKVFQTSSNYNVIRMSYSSEDDYIEWVTSAGGLYRLKLSSGEMLDCSNSGAKVISYERKDNKVQVKIDDIYGDDPVHYLFDLNTDYSERYDTVTHYEVYSNGMISFSSLKGPDYDIDYRNNKIIRCSSKNSEIISANQNGDDLELVLRSTKLPKKVRYRFKLSDIKKTANKVIVEPMGADYVESYEFGSDNRIVINTANGYFEVDCINKELLYGSVSNSKVISCELTEDRLTLELTNDLLNQNVKYIFDLSPNYDDDETIYDAMVLTGNMDVIEWMNYSTSGDYIEWDSSAGPLYRLRLSSGEITDCTSSGAKVLAYEYKGNTVTVRVKSDERPQKTQYVFDLTKSYPEGQDILSWYDVFSNGMIRFSSLMGPTYEIDYINKKILYCSVRNAELISVKKKDKKLYIVVRSEKIPRKMRYTFDLSSILKIADDVKVQPEGADYVEYYNFQYGDIIDFDSVKGPYYRINYKTGKVLDCSSDGAVIRSKSIKDNKLTLMLYSYELKRDVTYSFDMKKSQEAQSLSENDEIEWYTVNKKENTISFDTSCGPLYQIDYKNKTVLGCTSTNAVIKSCKVKGNTLTLEVYSDERPTNSTYKFDLTKNKEQDNGGGLGYGEFKGSDPVDFFNMLPNENAIEFDSQYGPYYKISLKNKGKILDCTSDQLFPDKPKAKILRLVQYDNMITITVYSAELPHKMTYIFNTSENVQSGSVTGYSEDSFDEEINKILESIYNNTYKGKGVSAVLSAKIREAKKLGKRIAAVLEMKTVSDDKVEKSKKKKIDKYVKDKKLNAVQYLDISIAVYANDELLGYITELDHEVEFYVGLINAVKNANKSFGVVNYHDGKAGYAKLRKKGKDSMSFASRKFSTFVIVGESKKNVKKLTVSCAKSKEYTGKKLTPKVTVKDGKKTLKKGTDYTVTYSGNVNVGTATVKITGKGNYTGTVKKTFKILPKGTSVKNVKSGKKSFTVTWTPVKTKMKKSRITGYQIQYSTSSSFAKGKNTVTVKKYSSNKTTVKISGKPGKYYVRIRTYMTVGGKKYCSSWSKAKKVK